MSKKIALNSAGNSNFVTMQKLEDGYWIVEASGNETQTKVVKKLKYLPDGVYNYSKVGRELAQELNLPFIKVNETPEKRLKKENRRVAKHNLLAKKEAAQQNNLKQQWQEWAAKSVSNEVALAEGIWACEQLARDLEVYATSRNEDRYMFFEPERDEDLSRLAQFNELKNLWLKRNQENVLAAKKLSFVKPNYPKWFGFNEYWKDTFFSDFESVQLYLYEVKICEKVYTLFVDKVLSSNFSEMKKLNTSTGNLYLQKRSKK